MNSAISFISLSFIPSLVTSEVPNRIPPGFMKWRPSFMSQGRRLRLMMMSAFSRVFSIAPPSPCFVTSTRMTWDSVNPLCSANTLNPASWRACAKAFAFFTICLAYSLPNCSISAHAKVTPASACRWWLLTMPGKVALFICSLNLSHETTLPCCGPKNVLCVLKLTTSAPSFRGSWNVSPAINPATWAAS